MEQMEQNEQQTQAIVQYKGMPISITFDDVTRFICPLADPKEVAIFLKTCQSLQLNPFANEIYLIKYSPSDKAAIVISIDSYLKAAEANASYDGHEAGIILSGSTGKLEFREGAFLLDEEREMLEGGWAKVYRKDRSKPYYVAVHKRECIKHRKDGTPTEFWLEAKQPWMLRKVALSRALVEAFPSLFAGLVPNVEYEELPPEAATQLPKPRGESEEGLEPQAFYKKGKPSWDLFWVRQKEKGVDGPRAHALLKCASIKKDLWEGQGKTLGEIDQMIDEALEDEKAAASAAPISPPLKGEEAEWEDIPPSAEPPAKEKRDSSTIKTIGDLMQACHEDFGLGYIEVLREANARTILDIVDPREVYRAIAVVREQ